MKQNNMWYDGYLVKKVRIPCISSGSFFQGIGLINGDDFASAMMGLVFCDNENYISVNSSC